ncbi:MAG: hypothetical protein LWY06_02800 [Firmicutes bacterium]|nr:hypothetical protein [Bacillota bacterium]
MQIQSNTQSGFQPKYKVDVYDKLVETLTGDSVKIGEAYSDGTNGQLNILNPRFKEQLTQLFTQPQTVMSGGGVADGTAVDGAPRQMEPWKPETLLYTTVFQLGNHNFRGEINTIG